MITSIQEPTMTGTKSSKRVAWLLQSAGHYWQAIVSEFVQLFPNTKVFTATWSGFMAGFEDAFIVKQVGTVKFFSLFRSKPGYVPGFTYLSPRIISHLLDYRPDVVFSVGFTMWTILALVFKPFCGWKVVIVYDGSSPGVDFRNSPLRIALRRLISHFTDAFITNNQTGKEYLEEALGANPKRVVARPYLVPHPKTYSECKEPPDLGDLNLQRPIFMFAGNLIPRKGIRELLLACATLKSQGFQSYSLLILGDGPQRLELETLVKSSNIQDQVEWVGGVEYEHMGAYFQKADIFIFPTLEDVWGLVAVEAMMFGLPILCSKWGGAVELVQSGENGFIFDPHNPEDLAKLMIRFMGEPELVERMGEKSKQIMTCHTPTVVAETLAQVVAIALDDHEAIDS